MDYLHGACKNCGVRSCPHIPTVSVFESARFWLKSKMLVLAICEIMFAARILLRTIELIHEYWPTCLNWLSDFMYYRIPKLKDIFSHETTRADVRSIQEILESCGIAVAEHSVLCEDGHELTVHHFTRQNSERLTPRGSPVLLLHGLLQDSDSFVCSGPDSLVWALLRAGHDVWCGNNRGTKYSSTHAKHDTDSEKFWDFNIDHLAQFDVPALVDEVLRRTGEAKLALVGFSQGSAQSFAALSISPRLNTKVSLFIALAPAVKTAAMVGMIGFLAITNPDAMTMAFGRRSFLPFVLRWQRLLTPQMFALMVSESMMSFFGWRCFEISEERRQSLYQFVYSTSSVQCVSHWLHVMAENEGRLCEFGSGGTGRGDYDISRITCPVAVLSGKMDTVIDASVVATTVQRCVYSHVEQYHEHLDLIWADDAPFVIFPKVVDLINKYSSPLAEGLPFIDCSD